MEGYWLYSESADIHFNLIQKHPQRNIQITFEAISEHRGPASVTHKIDCHRMDPSVGQ